jgi:hypothetical protein
MPLDRNVKIYLPCATFMNNSVRLCTFDFFSLPFSFYYWYLSAFFSFPSYFSLFLSCCFHSLFIFVYTLPYRYRTSSCCGWPRSKSIFLVILVRAGTSLLLMDTVAVGLTSPHAVLRIRASLARIRIRPANLFNLCPSIHLRTKLILLTKKILFY